MLNLKTTDSDPKNATEGGFDQLVESLRIIPGVGYKSAQRIAFDLLLHHRAEALQLANALLQALNNLRHCQQCNTLSDQELCNVCRDHKRDGSILCVVQSPTDQLMIEQTKTYNGLYFVLSGVLSPLDGKKASDIGFETLLARVQLNLVKEVILATHFTNEGELTAHFIADALTDLPVKVTRLAKGVPVGSELDQIDLGTLASSLLGRQKKF